ncbi:MAG: hypothetical protein ACFFC3_07030 [Candidatus Odinarchaeota archaeon]
MRIKPTVKIDPDDVVRYLLYQQFYYGDDRIYGRTKDRSEYIKGAGKAIENFYSLITEMISLIEEGKIRQYLELFNEHIHKIPIDAILNKFREYKDAMGSELDHKITLNVIVGDCLSEIQKTSFNDTITNLIEFIIKKKSLKPEQRLKVKKKIESLYGKSDPNIGMIYSLSFMDFISKKINDKYIKDKCEKLLKKYSKLILKTIEKK